MGLTLSLFPDNGSILQKSCGGEKYFQLTLILISSWASKNYSKTKYEITKFQKQKTHKKKPPKPTNKKFYVHFRVKRE